MSFASDEDREGMISRLLDEFQSQSFAFLQDNDRPVTNDEWELLARHHGLLSPILDWTASPFIAAFFAFDSVKTETDDVVSVWVLDRNQFLHDQPRIRLIVDDWMIRMNPRALEQRGAFVRVGGGSEPLEQRLGEALTRFDIPGSDRERVLADLDEMGITARSLFRNIDGAASLANRRVAEKG
jgi:hypothetical protein